MQFGCFYGADWILNVVVIDEAGFKHESTDFCLLLRSC